MKKIIITVISIIIALIGLIALFTSMYTVDYNTYVIVTKFGKIESIQTEPGLHFKTPFITATNEIFAGERIYDMPVSDVITKDKKSMIADDYVIWTVTDVKLYYQTLGAISARAEERIDAAVYNATKNTISSMTQEEIIAARGDNLTRIITEAANKDISSYGISINSAVIKSLDLPDDNKVAVYERMISERNNIAAGYTAQGQSDAQVIRNQTDRDASIIIANANSTAAQTIAEGEAEYMRILSDAYNDEDKSDFYLFLRRLDAFKNSFTGDENVIILDRDSEFARLLYGEA